MATLKNTKIDDTGYLGLPTGSTAQRPNTPEKGMVRWNTTESSLEGYDGTEWRLFSLSSEFIQATGGTESTITAGGNSYKVHTFTTSDTFTVSSAPSQREVEYLIVAGGGAGGADDEAAGGGGAGGMITGSLTINETSYTVTVGNGGVGATSPSAGQNGQDSSVFGLTAIGGGGGGGHETDHNNPAKDGGSGGGGASQDTDVTSGAVGGTGLQPNSTDGGFGNDGGDTTFAGTDSGAGGGGAGGVGQNQTENSPGDGGVGLLSDISGTSTFYAAGGGGSWRNSDPEGNGGSSIGGDGSNGTGGDGVTNTGSGGGAGLSKGGDGASGIVIIRYLV